MKEAQHNKRKIIKEKIGTTSLRVSMNTRELNESLVKLLGCRRNIEIIQPTR